MVPFWIFITGTCLFFLWYFFSMKTIYTYQYDKETGKLIKKIPERIYRYNGKKSDRETVFITCLIIWLLVTLFSLIIIL
jgi:hypothetical protein